MGITRKTRKLTQLHFNICKKIGAKLDSKHQCDFVPKKLEKNREGKVTILWKQQVQTDRTITNNKPDVTIRDSKQETSTLTVVAVPRDINVVMEEGEKMLKYKDLIIEIQRM